MPALRKSKFLADRKGAIGLTRQQRDEHFARALAMAVAPPPVRDRDPDLWEPSLNTKGHNGIKVFLNGEPVSDAIKARRGPGAFVEVVYPRETKGGLPTRRLHGRIEFLPGDSL